MHRQQPHDVESHLTFNTEILFFYNNNSYYIPEIPEVGTLCVWGQLIIRIDLITYANSVNTWKYLKYKITRLTVSQKASIKMYISKLTLLVVKIIATQ